MYNLQYLDINTFISKKVSLPKDTIHITEINYNLYTERVDEFLNILTFKEKKYAKTLSLSMYRKFVVGRAMLRLILSNYLNTLPRKLNLLTNKYGKLFLEKNTSSIQFNIAHSADLLLMAFSRKNELGIDIEKVRITQILKIAQRIFSQREYMELLKLPQYEQQSKFFTYWTYKEAYLKALGYGWSAPLWTYREKEDKISILPLSIDPSYKAAIAIKQNIK